MKRIICEIRLEADTESEHAENEGTLDNALANPPENVSITELERDAVNRVVRLQASIELGG